MSMRPDARTGTESKRMLRGLCMALGVALCKASERWSLWRLGVWRPFEQAFLSFASFPFGWVADYGIPICSGSDL